MRAGRLNRRVTLQAPATGQDEYGSPVTGWANVVTTGDGKVWASIDDLSGREFLAAAAEQSATTSKIRIRLMDGVEASMRVLHGSDIYNIKAALREGKDALLLMCEKGANNG